MALSELQQKLLRLALDKAAQPGEIQAAAIKFVESLRREGMKLEDILGREGARVYSKPDYGLTVMPFGKHKDLRLKEIDPRYLIWLRGDIESNGDTDRDIYKAIVGFMNQGAR